ncbi:MAG TPA: YbfB/YjiJ family MFS transporter [Stellaceae bacterium]|nr:YbfB/YjiJ family MFS transporter [Stellaceae bacterium]
MQAKAAGHPRAEASAWRATLSGCCASLVGVGLGRFAYSPLIPPLIAANWFSPSDAAYLGAANLVGYLAGALCARWATRLAPAALVLRAMMVLATAAFFACAEPWSFLWFFVWRFAAGLSGGVLMVLAAPTVLPHVPASRRGLTSGAIFMGVGLGVAASGTLVPLLLRWGLVETWCALGTLSLALTALGWGGWPGQQASPAAAAPATLRPHPAGPALGLKALYLEYGLNAVGLVPHMVFLVDFVARSLGRGLAAGALCWVLFGIGAMIGPVLAGHIADRIGFRLALRFGFVVQVAAVALLAFTAASGWLAVSSLLVGLFVPGVVPLALGRVQELVVHDADRQKAAWSTATAAFALGQAAAAYGFSFLFAHTGSYPPLFGLGAIAIALALIIDVAVAVLAGQKAAYAATRLDGD